MKSAVISIAAALTLASALSQAAFAAGDNPAAGRALFQQRCQMCHTVAPGQAGTMAPNLGGVVGRKAASTHFGYSPALKASGVVWTHANLAKFITNPQTMVPGTRMVISVPNAADRANLIAYLATTK